MSQFFVSYMVKTEHGYEPRAVTTPADSDIKFESTADIEDAARHLSLVEAREARGGADPGPDDLVPEIHIMGITRLPA